MLAATLVLYLSDASMILYVSMPTQLVSVDMLCAMPDAIAARSVHRYNAVPMMMSNTDILAPDCANLHSLCNIQYPWTQDIVMLLRICSTMTVSNVGHQVVGCNDASCGRALERTMTLAHGPLLRRMR